MQKLNKQLATLEKEKIWVNWFWGMKDGEKTKVPLGSTTNPETWKVFSDLDLSKNIGLVFPLEKSILGVDIDHCVQGNEIINDKKEQIVNFIIEADTYTEYSPSGTGLHLFFKLKEPLDLIANKDKDPKTFEAYTFKRFFTVTNKPYKEEKPIREITKEEALRLLYIIGYPWGKSDNTEVLLNSPIAMDDELLLEKMFSSKNGEKIKKLYDGDISDYANDESSADMALCSYLAFWTGGNSVQMERLWLKSPISERDKTVLRKDYRSRTIINAIKNCKEFYKENKEIPKIKEGSLVFTKSSEVTSKPINWLWRGKIAKGKVTLIAGDPGLGKSQLTLGLAGIVSTGGEFPGGYKSEIGEVLLFSAEDDIEDTITPRLRAVNACMERIFIFNMVQRKNKETFFDLSADVDLLEKTLEENRNISLIIIDPITAFLGDTDSHVNAEVRALLSKLSRLASFYGIAVVVITHLNKSTGGSPLNKITGSLAFVAAARAAFMVMKDENDESRRLFLTVKNNIAEDKGGFAFRVEGVELNDNIWTSRIVWEKEPISTSAVEVMKEQRVSENKVDRKTIEWIEKFLSNYPDGVSFDILLKAAMRNHISRRTLYRAQKDLMVDTIPNGFGKPKIWKIVDFGQGSDDINPDDVPL